MSPEQFRKYQEESFDSFCKTVIRHEAINAHKRLAALAEKEIPLSTLSPVEISKLCYEDNYRTYSRTYYVKDMPIKVYDPLFGEVLQYLSPQRRDVILLFYFLQYNDSDIARFLRISRSAVIGRKSSALKRLKELLEDVEDV